VDIDKEIDNYNICLIDGRKVIHYNGFTRSNEGGTEFDGAIPKYLAEEMILCYVPVDEYSAERLALEMEAVTQYLYPLTTENDVTNYLIGATHLPLREVNEKTPCGDYWCYLEEEE
jgi:hypothetical protein